jgi:mannan endo-1,4-beta-mannosidase
VKVGELVAEALGHVPQDRPYLDTEHGPIHSFKDKKKTLAEVFDDEYFRHIQWAHLASGGAGGGMRWPNRRPHILTPGMRRAQAALSGFLPLIDWPAFRRRNLSSELRVRPPRVCGFAIGGGSQAVVWLLRRDTLDPATGMLRPDAAPLTAVFDLPSLEDGSYTVTPWDTREGCAGPVIEVKCRAGMLSVTAPGLVTDLAFAIRPNG